MGSFSQHHTNTATKPPEIPCTNTSCFFCSINEPNPILRRSKIIQCFKEMPRKDDQEHVLALSALWNIAMNQPDDPEFPSLGIFECLSKLIHKGVMDRDWLLRDQNIYIPYYAAHIIGSYTMNKVQFAEKAAKSGVILPLVELLRGKVSWVEQRVAVRALGHIASHDRTFEAIAVHEEEIVKSTMEIASNCLDVIYNKFVAVENRKRVKYHSDLLTRGLGGQETESRKAEEWASQLQCWSLYLLNCFACKDRALDLICKNEFLKKLCGLWGGLTNRTSPAGIGLIRSLCDTLTGRESVADSREVTESLCNVSRSSDDWQYMAIDCLLLLLKDPNTRYKVIDFAALFLVDLVELGNLRERSKVGEVITQILLQDYHKIKYGDLKLKSKKAEKALEEVWYLKVERIKREKLMPEQEMNRNKRLVGVLKQEGNHKFWSGHIKRAVKIYSKALDLCPLSMTRERIVLHSNRAQCYLVLREPEAAVSESTRALCLSSDGRPHSKSLWRRSQAYDMKGLAKESLMDCLMFINGRMKFKQTKHVEIPYYAARMINKQMNATWIFADAMARSKTSYKHEEQERVEKSNVEEYVEDLIKKKKRMSTVVEEELIEKQRRIRKLEKSGRRKRSVTASGSARLAHIKIG